MATTLTRNEARERAALLTVRSYRVELDVTGSETVFTSVTTADFSCSRPGAETFIDLAAAAVREITLNGEPLSPSAHSANRIALPGLRAENELRIVADCEYSRSGEGLHRFTDPADGGVYLYTNFEPWDAHRVFACFDQPDLKASFQFTVTAPAGDEVISNMAPDTAGTPVPGGPGGPGAGGSAQWHFPPTPPLPTYISAVAAGPYHVVRTSHDGIPLGIYCRRSLAPHLDPDEIFEVTGQGFGFYQQAFGLRYPFTKYDQLFVPEFNSGAMENAGCVTILEDYIFRSRVTDSAHQRRASTILHEMAHMWFGDLVTMRWWDDLWLNESFATWAAAVAQAEATRWPDTWTGFAQLEKAWAYRQDQLPTTHPIAADIPDIAAVEVNFDGITYAKGAAVLKQLVAYVGRENFLAAVRQYFGEHGWGNATLADLLGALTGISGRELSGWSKQWLETAGVNTLYPEFETDAAGAFTSFAVRQEATAAHPVLRDHRIAIGLYQRTPAGLVRQRRVETDISGELTAVPELTGETRPDLVLLNDDDLTYAKIRLDEVSLATLRNGIGEFTDSLPAVLCWSAVWDMCRDAELPARDYIQLVLAGAPSTTDIAVTQTLLRRASLALHRYADPGWRGTGRGLAAAELRHLAEAAEAGSDAQLAYVHAFTSAATSPADLALLAGLLDGSATLDGLAVDTDLRWSLLSHLVRLGAVAGPEIEAELARDPTDTGARRAATCRAAIPGAATKQAAWDELTSGSLPNAMFRAVLEGFTDSEHPDLMAPYQQRYFDVVGGIWQRWSTDMAQWFVTYAYPLAVSPEVVQATDDLITRDSPPPALRRLLLESRDDTLRALRCQQRDRQAAG